MMMSSNVIRMCAISRVKCERSKLVKVTRVCDIWYVDLEQKLDGRSFYLDVNKKNLEKFKKQRYRFKMSEDNFETVVARLEGVLNE